MASMVIHLSWYLIGDGDPNGGQNVVQSNNGTPYVMRLSRRSDISLSEGKSVRRPLFKTLI